MKNYDSFFLSGEKVDISNYLTEILIYNYVNFKKYNMPNCPFWRKECRTDIQLEELGRRYVIELVGVKQLLKQFSQESIASYFKKKKCFSFKLLKKHNQEKIKSGIAAEEAVLSKQLSNKNTIPIVEQQSMIKTNTFKTQKGKLDL